VRAALAWGFGGAIVALVALAIACTPATAAKVQAVDNTVTDVTGLACALAPDSPVGQGVTLVDNAVEADARTAMAITTTVQLRSRVVEFQYPAAGAAAFLARHKAK
jgi:hypothetical protein